ncbi:MAG: hypothetical protein M1819_004532 [Sarea resinae]|nr:MAG: hypothetical protein M1819_004532 [Sarea resinae]
MAKLSISALCSLWLVAIFFAPLIIASPTPFTARERAEIDAMRMEGRSDKSIFDTMTKRHEEARSALANNNGLTFSHLASLFPDFANKERSTSDVEERGILSKRSPEADMSEAGVQDEQTKKKRVVNSASQNESWLLNVLHQIGYKDITQTDADELYVNSKAAGERAKRTVPWCELRP